MKTIEQQLALIKKTKRIGLMTHVVIGYPSLEETKQIVKDMAQSGVDFIELQIPFSDPLADGPTIMQANDKALANGITLADCLRIMAELSVSVDIPLLFMAYYNSIFHVGVESFCRQAQQAGCQGLIIPDMPIDEELHEHFIAACKKYRLHHIRLLSPTSTDDRIKQNATVENAFVYCTSRAGITGASKSLNQDTAAFLDRVRQFVTVPIALGFGISQPEHIKALVDHADIAIVGSAVIDQISKRGRIGSTQLVKQLANACL